MHDHDLDLIAAYVDGTDEHGEGRRLVESCSDCLREFTAQVEIRDRLGSLEAPLLTSSERKVLRSAVDRELDRGATITPLTRRWVQVGTVAAAFVVVAGMGAALFRGFGGQDAGGAFETLSSPQMADGSLDAATTMAAEVAAAPAAAEFRRENLGTVGATEFADRLAELGADHLVEDTTRAVGAQEFSGQTEEIPCVGFLESPFIAVLEAEVVGRHVVGFITAGTDPPLEIAFYADSCEVFDLDR